MRIPFLMSVLVALSSPEIFAQENDVPAQDDAANVRDENEATAESTTAMQLKSYDVLLTDFQWQSPDPQITSQEIVKSFDQLKDDGKLSSIETVRLSVLEGHECMVQFGKTVAVVVGRTGDQIGRPGAVSTRDTKIGTILRVKANTRSDDTVLLKIEYEASRLSDADMNVEIGSPEINVRKVGMSVVVKPGTPILLGGTSADPTSYMMLSITK